MAKYIPSIMLVAALLLVCSTLWIDGTYLGRGRLIKAVSMQAQQNTELKQMVENLRDRVNGLGSDPRSQEREIRSQLGMLKESEAIVVFNDSSNKQKKK